MWLLPTAVTQVNNVRKKQKQKRSTERYFKDVKVGQEVSEIQAGKVKKQLQLLKRLVSYRDRKDPKDT